ncbi:F0F1 ATP synthase subunit delta [Pueribacillus theae]|uniref:ATP synthase subunit delta n=1 Tax=Pueribacillus theae TaxID=2171751 RepID=A0A2U1K413_9BACI|nr:F0F1 ATP synthase subunit delta [Pueribacillus theae]PWA11879.1 F0F1 ATP synthase subunit delta [Pueribacillus theae]
MSMSNEVVAKRYAIALFELAEQDGTVSQIEKEMELVKQLFQDNGLQSFFSHPKITIQQKKAILSGNLKNAVSENVINTLFLMLDRKRGDSIAEMAEQYIQLAMEKERVADAVVYSVRPLTEKEQKEISKIFAEKVGKQELRMRNVINPDLIGGLRIRVGNQIFDGSVSGKLERMKRELAAANA